MINDPLLDMLNNGPRRESGTLPGMEYAHQFLGSRSVPQDTPAPERPHISELGTPATYPHPIPGLGVGLPAARNINGIQFRHHIGDEGTHIVHAVSNGQSVGHTTWNTNGDRSIGGLAVDHNHPQSSSILTGMLEIASSHPDNKVGPAVSANRTPDSERLAQGMQRRGYVINERNPVSSWMYDPFGKHGGT